MNKIALVGMMGSGKSTIGLELAKNLIIHFYDLDQLIEKKENKTINEIFQTQGERYFRDLESHTLESFLKEQNKPCILALGGGAYTSYHQKMLTNHGFKSFYLKCDVDELVVRLLKILDHRPLIKDLSPSDLRVKIETLSKLRESDYRQADYTVKSLNEILEIITSLS